MNGNGFALRMVKNYKYSTRMRVRESHTATRGDGASTFVQVRGVPVSTRKHALERAR